MDTEPPNCLISLATTSIPTPRPDIWVTFSAVLKPACIINCMISWSEISSSALITPRSIAFLLTASTLIPPPSSLTFKTRYPLSRESLRLIFPVSGLLAAKRLSLDSMPWSTAFLSICSSGATIFSSTFRSNSPSTLNASSLTDFPTSALICLTILLKRGINRAIGTMRVRVKPSWISVPILACWCSKDSTSRLLFLRVSFKSSISEEPSLSVRDISCNIV